MFRDFPRQCREHAAWYLIVGIALVALLAIVVYLHRNTHIIVTELFEDPVEFGILPQHVGMYSYLAATVMVVAGSLMVFTAFSVLEIARDAKQFLVVLGAFLLWLGLDDVFMIHEWVGLRLSWLIQSDNVPYDRQWLEAYVFAAYALAWMVIVLVFQRVILRSAWILLALTFASFGLSVGLDMYSFIDFLPQPKTRDQAIAIVVMEDMGKLAGGFFALAYAINVSNKVVRGRFATGTI